MQKTKLDLKQRVKRQKLASDDNDEKIIEEFEPQKVCLRCHKICALKIDINHQKKLYDSFYSRNFSEQTLLIRELVTRVPAKNNTDPHNPTISSKRRKYDYFIYNLKDEDGIEQEVCRKFFMNCFKIDRSHIQFALSSLKATSTSGEINSDVVKREDRRIFRQFISEEATRNVLAFIDLFPRYESNYNRTSDKKFLSPNLNFSKLYNQYKFTCDQKQQEAVCFSSFHSVLDNISNMRLKRHSNICKTCSHFADILRSVLPQNKQEEMENQRDKHMEQTRKINSEFKQDIDMAFENEGLSLVLTFDLQRALETPSLTVSASYYKRPLWTNNLCIYDEVRNQGYMYVWNESVASRRALEIGSCLLYHLKHYMPSRTQNIILYTNSCRSQNQNIKIALFLKHFLLSSSVKTIKQKFFISTHNNKNSCNKCFSFIEKERTLHEVVATPDDWLRIICASKNNNTFVVTKMQTGDFFTSKCLEKKFNVNSRKTSKTGNNFDWSSIREISQCRETPLSLSFSCENESMKEINLKDRQMREADFKMAKMECLHPLGKAISKSKYMDLMELKSHIPKKSWEFFDNLRYDATIDKDFGIASDSSDVEN